MAGISIFRNGQPEIIGVDVDIRFGEFHSGTASVTQLPIEEGSVITDHIVLNPRTVEISAMVSNYDGEGTASIGERAITAWQDFERLRRSRQVFDLVTTHELYSNMAFLSITGANEAPYQGRLTLRASFVQIDINQSSIVTIPESRLRSSGEGPVSKTASSQVDAGRAEVVTEEENRSLAAQILDSANAAEASN